MLLGLAVRLITLGQRFSSDDSYTWVVAHATSWSAFYDRLIAYENTPPLYYAVARMMPADGEAWLRLPAVLASAACVPIAYAIVRPLAGTRAALLAAAGLSIAPFALTLATLARGFAFAELALLAVVWAAARLAQGGPRGWWWLYGVGSVAALYSEYSSALVLVLVAVVLLIVGPPRRWETILFAALPCLLFVPWLPSLSDSLDAVHISKAPGVVPDATVAGARIVLNSLVYGRLRFDESGTALGGPRALLALVVLAAAAIVVWRMGDRRRILFLLAFAVPAGTFLGHWILAAAGQDGVFDPRYMNTTTALLVIGLATAVSLIPWRPLVPLVTAGLAVVAVATIGLRWGRDPNPPMQDVVAAADAAQPGTVVTNTAIVSYYLRDLHPRLDRAFGFGDDLSTGCDGCARPLVVVDDSSPTAGGVRPAAQGGTPIGRFVVAPLPN